ncbi:hypothetical protein K7432_009266 [Basidiobolus ranarum]|uniref:Uncharacterized protein n=1 Tax=Basidiobolus ranarum TaxID=34480 RepID=A0ABR2VY36_9FUNG
MSKVIKITVVEVATKVILVVVMVAMEVTTVEYGGSGSKYPPLSGGSTCPDLVADLCLLGIPVKAEVCLESGGGGSSGGNSSNGGGNHCVIGANAGISKLLGVDLCIGGSDDNKGGYPGNGGNGNGSHPTCQDIRAKVLLLGIKVDANICLGDKSSGPNALCPKMNVNLELKKRNFPERILATK